MAHPLAYHPILLQEKDLFLTAQADKNVIFIYINDANIIAVDSSTFDFHRHTYVECKFTMNGMLLPEEGIKYFWLGYYLNSRFSHVLVVLEEFQIFLGVSETLIQKHPEKVAKNSTYKRVFKISAPSAMEAIALASLNLSNFTNATKYGLDLYPVDIYFTDKLRLALFNYSHQWDAVINRFLRNPRYFSGSDFERYWRRYGSLIDTELHTLPYPAPSVPAFQASKFKYEKPPMDKSEAIENIKNKIKDLDECFLIGPRISSDGKFFWRGMSKPYPGLSAKDAIGNYYMCPGFISTSKLFRVALSFTEHDDTGAHGSVIYRINPVIGVPFIDTWGNTPYSMEMEILFPRDLELKKIGTEQFVYLGITYPIVVLEISTNDSEQFPVWVDCLLKHVYNTITFKKMEPVRQTLNYQIQQPPKKKSKLSYQSQQAKKRSESKVLKVITLNTWDGFAYISTEFMADYLKSIYSERPDFIFLQEAPKHRQHLLMADGYEILSFNMGAKGKYENLMTLRNTASAWTISAPEIITSQKCYGAGKRISTIQMATHVSGAEVQISNVHLCGGRFDEEKMCGRLTPGFPEYSPAERKLDMLTEIIPKIAGRPSIILGDFNRDFLVFENPDDMEKLAYLTELGCTVEKARLWHTAPYELLADNGYTRVEIGVDPTSKYGTQSDGIWYTGLTMQEGKILHTRNPGFIYSDHHGVMASFLPP